MSTYQVSAIFKAIDQFSRPLRDMERSMSGFGNATKSSIAMAERGFRKLTPTFSSATKELLSFASKAAIVTALISGLFSSYQDIVNYEKSIASLSAITGATGDVLKGFEKQVQNVAKETKKSSIEVAKAFEVVGSAKPELLANSEALAQVTRSAIVLSKASGDDLELSVRNLTGSLNQFSLGAEHADRVMNVLAAGSLHGSASISLVNESMKNFGAVASDANISIEQSVALIETMADKQIVGADAGTKLRSAILKLQKAQLGYASGQFNINDALEEAKSKMDAFGSAMERDSFMTKVFGEESRVAGSVLLNNIDRFNQLSKAVEGTNVANEQANKNSNTLSNRLTELSNAWTTLLTSTDSVNSGLNVFKDIIVLITDNLGTIVTVVGVYIGSLIAMKVAITAAKIVMFGYNVALGINTAITKGSTMALKGNMVAMGAYRVAMIAASIGMKAATAAQWLFNVAMTANPIGIVIVAIGALVAGLAWLTDGFTNFGDFFSFFWDDQASLLENIGMLFVKLNPFYWLLELLEYFFPGIKEGIFEFFSSLWDGIYNLFIQPLIDAWDWISGLFGDEMDTSGLDKVNASLEQFDNTVSAEGNVNVNQEPINANRDNQELLVRSIEEKRQNLDININDGSNGGASFTSSGDIISTPVIKPSFGI